ncbi:MAG: hypothetical protein A4S12_01210 [Proteobacteria bacterium SG_bin5]|nr:hypothetical protein [Sphingomonas sp.]OQW42280.1 MAG: hypothetical protein A4S12_01210 [Proteobacteria bacterium SG_bin5]
MMALLGTILFGGALLLVAQIFLDTLLPALPWIAALLRAEAPQRAASRAPAPRVIRRTVWRAAA